MALQFTNRSKASCSSDACLDKFGCPEGVSPDFSTKRHDTKPPFKVFVEDCNGAMDLRGMVVEANMWAKATLRDKLDEVCTYFRLADNIGFEQIMVGDVIVVDRVRLPEYMLVTGFDETNFLVQVDRGYRGTTPSSWKKGTKMRIFRIMDAPAETELTFDDLEQEDGTTEENVLTESFLIYEWSPEDTCLPGCYFMEFKLLKMKDVVYFLPGGFWEGAFHQRTSDNCFFTGSIFTDSSVKLSFDQIVNGYQLPDTVWTGETHIMSDATVMTGSVHNDGSVLLNQTNVSTPDGTYDDTGLVGALNVPLSGITPSFTDSGLTPGSFGCILGEGVEWVRRFPVCGEGFLVKIEDSPTTEI